MDRRTFLRGALALPLVTALAPLLPRLGAPPLAAILPTAERVALGAKLWESAFVSRVDISDLLYANLKAEHDWLALLSVEQEAERRLFHAQWVEDAA